MMNYFSHSKAKAKASLQEDYEVDIFVDCDDVVVPQFGTWIKRMAAACDPPLTLSEADWDVSGGFPKVLLGKKLKAGLTLPQGRVTTGEECFIEGFESAPNGVIRHEFMTPDLYDEMKPYPGVAEAITRMTQIPRAKVLCATAHTAGVSDDLDDPVRLAYEGRKKGIFKQYIPAVSETDIIFTRDKDKLVAKNRICFLIDDTPKNIEKFQAAGGHGILLNRSWNLNVKVENAIRVNDLNEAHQVMLAKIEEEKKKKGLQRGLKFQYSHSLSPQKPGAAQEKQISHLSA